MRGEPESAADELLAELELRDELERFSRDLRPAPRQLLVPLAMSRGARERLNPSVGPPRLPLAPRL